LPTEALPLRGHKASKTLVIIRIGRANTCPILGQFSRIIDESLKATSLLSACYVDTILLCCQNLRRKSHIHIQSSCPYRYPHHIPYHADQLFTKAIFAVGLTFVGYHFRHSIYTFDRFDLEPACLEPRVMSLDALFLHFIPLRLKGPVKIRVCDTYYSSRRSSKDNDGDSDDMAAAGSSDRRVEEALASLIFSFS
jgi:hypothetical protein